MRRLPLIKVLSSEHDRLPAHVVKKKLNADASLQVNVAEAPKPNGKHVVYYFEPMELHDEQIQRCFILVEVSGTTERILAKGETKTPLSLRPSSEPFGSFHAELKDMGNFIFHCHLLKV